MSRLKSVFVVAVTAMAGVVVLAGCSEVIKQDELTSNIKSQFKEQTDTELTSIECDEVKAEEGADVACKATNENDMKLDITGKVTGKNDDTGKWGFNWKVAGMVAPGKVFEEPAAETVTREFNVALDSVKCPDGIEVKEGTEVKCEGTATDGTTRGLTLNLTDAEGGFRVSLDGK